MVSRDTSLVRSGSLCAASRMASIASVAFTPSISNRILPGRTTATQWSGAPLPLPIRVSAGFFVTGLSGNTRIQILPPRFTKRVMATRLASICRSVIHPGSSTFKPKSPNARVDPAHALPHMRPRCCLRYFTFFGINIKSSQFPVLGSQIQTKTLESAGSRLRLALLGRQNLAFVHPALHADHAVRRPRFGEAVVDVGTQRVQRQPPLQIPLRPRDFVAVQTSAHANFDSLAAEAQRRVHRLAHRAAEADALFQLQRDRLRHQLRVELGLVYFRDVDKNILAPGALLQIALELID